MIAQCEKPVKNKSQQLCNAHNLRRLRHGNALGGQHDRLPPDGRRSHPIYKTWHMMITRCYNENYDAYHRWGGRGIRVCDRWRGSAGFNNFISDMGERPTARHTLDRKDNNGNYTPDNCRWATRLQQSIGHNLRSDNKSGTPGVSFRRDTQKWYVRLTVSGVVKRLGSYEKLEDAVIVRKKAEAFYNLEDLRGL